MLSEGTYRAVYDPTETYVLPREETLPAAPDLSPLQRALAKLQESAKNYQAAFDSQDVQTRLTSSADVQARLDRILMGFERSMTREAGLPRRPWFKHQVYAPGFYTGYGVKTLPGVREAVEQHNWAEAAEQVGLTAAALERAASEIDRASALLQGK